MKGLCTPCENMTLEEKIAQMIGVSFNGTTYSSELQSFIEDIGVGLVIYFKSNIKSLKQVFELNKQMNQKAKIPPFIALDQEGGMVMRITEGIVLSPGAMSIGATKKYSHAYELAYNMGRDLRKLGFNFNFAPVADINNNPKNPVINVRSYSDKPEIVANFMVQAAKGYQDAKLMTSVKHFPGHGDTEIDSHLGLPRIDYDKNQLYKMEFFPFLKAKELDLPGIMTSHIIYSVYDPLVPATLSENVITGLLRTAMGYDGLVITDSLTMAAIYNHFSLDEIILYGFNSGCDMFLICGNYQLSKQFYQTALRLAKEGKIQKEKIDCAVARILKYKRMFDVGKQADSFEQIESKLNDELLVQFCESVSLESITLIKDKRKLLPIMENEKVLFVIPKIQVVTMVDNPKGDNPFFNIIPDSFVTYSIYLSPSDEEKNRLLVKIPYYDKVVFCSYNACLDEEQASLINQLDPKKSIIVSLRSPYDSKVFKDDFTYLCAYEATPLSLKALIKILKGEKKATGKCPVKL